MYDLIPITLNESGEPIVSGRMLHDFLEVGTEYRHWFPRMCEYGFADGFDYTPVIFEHPKNHQPTTDHALTIDMAKELSMIQRNEKGKQARQYFIQVEKDFNSPDKIIARALIFAGEKINTLQLEVKKKDQLKKAHWRIKIRPEEAVSNRPKVNTAIGASGNSASSSGTTLFALLKYVVSMFVSHWTSTVAGRVDATISSRASQTTVNAIKTKTDLITNTPAGTVKRIVRGTYFTGTTSNPKLVFTGYTVNPAKCALKLTASNSAGTALYMCDTSGFTSTEILLKTVAGTYSNMYFTAEVVEYY